MVNFLLCQPPVAVNPSAAGSYVPLRRFGVALLRFEPFCHRSFRSWVNHLQPRYFRSPGHGFAAMYDGGRDPLPSWGLLMQATDTSRFRVSTRTVGHG